jgi:5-methylcytosine-specific restriction endonuclease McrA
VTYNTDRRRSLSKKQRAAFLAAHDYTCHWCGGLIVDDHWQVEHLIPKELMPPGSAWDAEENKAPIHSHPHDCHKQKNRRDVAMIAKSNRVRRKHGVDPDKRKRRPPPIRPRPFPKQHRPLRSRSSLPRGRKIPTRPFQKRRT